jgi:hypothetical protein
MPVTNRQELVDWAMRANGWPVVAVNVSCDQIDQAVEEALELYQEQHTDATMRVYRKHQITADDVTNKWIPIPDSMISVTNVMIDNVGGSSDPLFNAEYQLFFNELWDMNGGSIHGQFDIVNYTMTKQYLALIDLKVNGMTQLVRYNRNVDKLYIDGNNKLIEGNYIVIEGYEQLNPEEYTQIYNDRWLKRYLSALIKRQWAINLKKYTGVQMIGGVEINGSEMYSEAKEEIQALEEEMDQRFRLPIDFFVG